MQQNFRCINLISRRWRTRQVGHLTPTYETDLKAQLRYVITYECWKWWTHSILVVNMGQNGNGDKEHSPVRKFCFFKKAPTRALFGCTLDLILDPLSIWAPCNLWFVAMAYARYACSEYLHSSIHVHLYPCKNLLLSTFKTRLWSPRDPFSC